MSDAFTLEAIQPPAVGSGGYRVPGPGRLTALQRSIEALLAGDAGAARAHAGAAEYLLCRGEGAEAALALWRPPPGEGQATFVLRTGPARPLIVEAPHPLHDRDTLPEAVLLFQRLAARALIASGTHRCANGAPSGCSGTTDVQGRHLNGAAVACTEAGTASSRRFIHLEQSREVRAQPERVAAVLDAVLP